jgi:molecular chaperone GrpE
MEADVKSGADSSASEEQPVPLSEVEAASVESLRKELEAALTQATEYLDGMKRARAEFINYKKRVEREQAESQQAAAGRVIARFLEVLDDMDRALADIPRDGDGARWAAGITLIHRKFQGILESEGVTRIEAEGATFDPALHEAITHEDSDGHAPNQVIGVVRNGYKLGDRVIRPALVRVAR